MFKTFYSCEVLDTHLKFASKTRLQYGDPKERDFYYPVDKRRSRANIESTQLAERNLDDLWRRVDQRFKMKAGKTLRGLIQGYVFQNRDLKRTQDWVEPTMEMRRKEQSPGTAPTIWIIF